MFMKMVFLPAALVATLVAPTAVLSAPLRCQGWLPDGNGPYDVDWWQAYKMPHGKNEYSP